MSDLVVVADHDAVRVLTLNRPESRNALNRNLIRALYDALVTADADDAVRAVVLTGTDPAFCAGIDLKEAARDGLDYFAEFTSQSCITAVAEMRAKGVTVLGTGEPRIGAHGTPVVFLHPRDMGGVLIELMETPRDGH